MLRIDFPKVKTICLGKCYFADYEIVIFFVTNY